MDVLFRALLDKSVADDVKNKYGLPDELCAPTSKTIVCSIPDCGTVFDYLYYVKDVSTYLHNYAYVYYVYASNANKYKIWKENAKVARLLVVTVVTVVTVVGCAG